MRMLVIGLLLLSSTLAQYMSVNLTSPFQCGAITIGWSGDEGPYHLLLTPIEIRQHSYNVWVPTINNGTNQYTMTLRQPEGVPFMVTVWGKSGIQFAGTTDIYNVGPPSVTNSSCFLSDQDILDRYSFAFNTSNTQGGYPPQCSTMTISWPTSLEQNVTGTIAKRDLEYDYTIDPPLEQSIYPPRHLSPEGMFKRQTNDGDNDADDTSTSTSSDRGNTTNPPTMFGLIPLGNSFSIPITYPANSSFADSLPESSISSQPTTFTSHGVTYLNWTLPLAKGTRFLLVAGIGSAEQWASGGSSRLMTVGQGDESCLGTSEGPSVTANPTNTDSIPTATRSPDDGSTPDPPARKSSSNLVKIVLACVISIVGTLVLVLGLWLFRRWKRGRTLAMSSPDKKSKGRVDPYDPNLRNSSGSGDTQMDLLGTNRGLRLDTFAPTSPTDPFGTPTSPRGYGFVQGPSRSSTFDTMSPTGTGTVGSLGRQSSQEALLSHATPTLQSQTASPAMRSATTRRLALHDIDTFGEEEESSDLKRETLAVLETQPGSSNNNNRRQRQRRDDIEMEYVVHRDGGRARVELPPRYDEVEWEERD